jgi:hypothetical protein
VSRRFWRISLGIDSRCFLNSFIISLFRMAMRCGPLLKRCFG